MNIVKLTAEYLERAHQFERMAAAENDPALQADFEKQARAYRKLAEKRTQDNTGLPLPGRGKADGQQGR